MSQAAPTQTKRSSQVPRSRAPRGGSSGSGSQQPDPNADDNGLSRRQSNVTFGPAPSVDPDDSISRIKTRSTWPGPNANSDRKGSRSTRDARKSYRSQVSKTSSRHGIAWSGSGAALTENNLEQFNEATEKQRSSGGYSNQEPQSDQQKVPRNTQKGSRSRYGNGTNANGGGQSKAGAEQEAAADSRSQSKQQRVAPSKNVIDANTAAGGGSQSKAGTQSRSRKDSKVDENAQSSQSQNAATNPGSGSTAPSKRSPSSRAPASPTSSNPIGGWERTTKIITRRYPDGRETREREVTHRPIAAV